MEKPEYRFYIKTRTLLGFNAITIHDELTRAYGQQAISYSTVQKWTKVFHEGKMEIEDLPRAGRPVTKITPENVQQVFDVIQEDPHSTYHDIEAETLLTRGTIERIIHDYLKLRKVISRWVPHELTDDQKRLRVKFCKENLAKILNGSWRLCDFITGDETWIYHRQIGRKASNACWIGKEESPGTVVRRGQDEPKVLFSIFFRSNGGLFVHSVGKGQRVDHAYYINKCLKPMLQVIKEQRPLTGAYGMKLLHDGASSHTAKNVEGFLKQEGIILVPHPAYSPDLSPCDYWLNDYIKRNLADQKTTKALHDAVTEIVFSIPENEYKKTFSRLIDRMRLCIKNRGEYFEHLIE